jgi:hypothetical protein
MIGSNVEISYTSSQQSSSSGGNDLPQADKDEMYSLLSEILSQQATNGDFASVGEVVSVQVLSDSETQNNNNNNHSGGGGAGDAATIGPGVGGALFAALLVGAGYYYYKKRNARPVITGREGGKSDSVTATSDNNKQQVMAEAHVVQVEEDEMPHSYFSKKQKKDAAQ